MTISTQMNQMAQTPLKAQLAAIFNANTLPVMIDPAQVGTLYAGDFVKLVNATGKNILVQKAAATDSPFGVIIFTPKKQSYVAGDAVEVACDMSVVFLESAGVIARGANVEYTPTGTLVTSTGGVNPICGIALDNATAANQLIRVLVRTSPVTGVFTRSVQALNGKAATVIIDPTAGGVCTIAPTVNATINAASTPAGMPLNLIVTSNGKEEILTFGTGFKSAGTLNTGNTNAKVFQMSFVSDGTQFVEEGRTDAM